MKAGGSVAAVLPFANARFVARSSTWLALVALIALTMAAAVLPMWIRLNTFETEQKAGKAALAAARGYAPDMLSYDYRSARADLERAKEHTTGKLTQHYDKLLSVLPPLAEKQRTIAQAIVVAAAVEDATTERVNVLLFVDQSVTKAEDKPEQRFSQNRVRFTMVKQEDRWLVTNIDDLIP